MNVNHAAQTRGLPRAESFVPALVAALLGVFLLYGSGFASANALHEAAHDSRHAFSFPCH